MGARQNADLADDLANLRQAATVDAALGLDDVAAHNTLLHRLERRLDVDRAGALSRRVGRGEGGERLVPDFGDAVAPLVLLHCPVSVPQARLGDLAHPGSQLRKVRFRHVARRLGRLFRQIDDRIDDRLESAMAEHHRVEHHLLAKLLGLLLDHHYGIGGAGDHEIEFALLHLGKGRVEDIVAVDEPDPGGSDRPEEGNA